MKVSIKAMRVNSELSQSDVAREMHVNPATIVSWESNKTFPNAQQLNMLCCLYNCTMDDIFVPDKLT